MASIHKKKTSSGRIYWELTHGSPPNRTRFKAGDTKEQAEQTLRAFKQRLALHGEAPGEVTVQEAAKRYLEFVKVNRSHSTYRRYARVLKTFTQCFLPQFHPGVKVLREIKPGHLEDYKAKRLAGEITEVKKS